jgi:hypothetical protein
VITLYVAPGMAALGVAISFVNIKALAPLLGVAVLVGCISMGLFAASRAAGESQQESGKA